MTKLRITANQMSWVGMTESMGELDALEGWITREVIAFSHL